MRIRKNRISNIPNVCRRGGLYCSIDRITPTHGFVSGDTAYYYITDRRGSVRQVINGSTGEVEKQYHYYPYGGHFGESAATALTKQGKDSPQRFGGKEMAGFAPMRFLDFPARPYDYSLLQFLTDDPMREKYYGLSPRLFCGADPINNCDPTGMKVELSGTDDEIEKKMA